MMLGVCMVLLQVESEGLEGSGTSSAAILGLAVKNMIGVFPQSITGKAAAIRPIVESLLAT
jgi:hypothetical protein